MKLMKTQTKLFLSIIIAGLIMVSFYMPQETTPKAQAYNDGCVLAFQANNGQYMQAIGGGGGDVYAVGGGIGSWESFTVVNVGGGKVALQTTNGSYLQAVNSGGSTFNATGGLGSWEQFTIIDLGGGSVALRTNNDVHYVVAENGGGTIVNADRTSIGAWETWTAIEVSGCTVVTCTDNSTVQIIQAAPGSVNPNQVFSVTIRVTDTGDTRWYHGSAYQFLQQSGLNISPTYGHLPYAADPNDFIDWTFSVTAPATPGGYNLQMRMLHYAGWDYQKVGGATCPGPGANTYFGQTTSIPFTVVAPIPTVTTQAASAITTSSATLNGTANPNGTATTGFFRYSSTNPVSCNNTFGTRAPAAGGSALGSGSTGVAYSQPISGLTSGTLYYFCAIASNTGGVGYGSLLTFTTSSSVPTVTTNAASGVTQTSATLNGTANPNGLAATGFFRYWGSNPGVCNNATGTRIPGSGGTALGSGTSGVAFSQPVSGLTSGTTYWFCAIATNAAGTGLGALSSFTTGTPPPACSSVSPTGQWTIANSGTWQSFANGVSGTSDVHFWVWSDVGGQDDLFDYHVGFGTTNLGGGTWRADIDLSRHLGLGNINVHVYLTPGFTNLCGTLTLSRLNNGTINVNLVGVPQATTWKIECPLTGPSCPNVNQTPTTANQSYPSKPYSSWTITPDPVPGYNWQVSGCPLNTPCTQTFP